MKKRSTAAALLTTALIAGGSLAAAPAASANAYGCHADVCINVPGHDNYVGRVTVYLDLGPRESGEGRFYVLRSGHVAHRSSYRHYKNESYFHSHRWSNSYTFDEYLFKGERVCGKFVGGGKNFGEACETVG